MVDANNNTGDCNTGNWNTGNCNTGYRNTGNHNTSNWNTGNCNTGNNNTGYCNTGDCNTGDRNTGDYNTGSFNSGDYNTGSFNSGYCNTITPEEVLIFNRPGKRKDWLEAAKPDWMFVKLTEWVYEEDMTSKEKETYPTYVTNGGYLKCYSDLKHAYIESWEKASKEDREKTYKLPNFDPIVFQEIFGFNPCECVEEKREHKAVDIEIVEINGVKYKRLD